MRKVVLVTGSSKGIGAAIIKKFASLGYDVVINYLKSEKEALELKNYVISTYKVNALTIKADVSNETEVREMINKIINEFGNIDCLVNNGAITLDDYFYDKKAEDFLKVLNTNLVGTFLTCKYYGKYLLDNERTGTIINISSTNGIDTNEVYSMDYDASKAGIISLTKNFAAALAPNVRVNTVAPGWTKTEAVMEMNPNYLEDETKKIMLKRFALPEEIANVVAFLASEEASYINNSVIRVDGGIK